MHTRLWQSLYIFFIVSSTLILALLDLLKQFYAEKLEVMLDMYINIALFLWLPLSFFVTTKVLTVGPAGFGVGNSQTGLKDSVALLGCAQTWLILNSIMSPISAHANFSCNIPSSLFFAFCYGSLTLIVSSSLTIIIYGLCLQACGIEKRCWGYFQPVHGMVMIPLLLFQHIATFLEKYRVVRHSDGPGRTE
ncbi:hypothetical protein C8R42DRAFT_656573 [Lentinula raphanica]|nr:hypothetical protein C8R42DRAFT_656573 [Lentinula raphanica]